MQAVPLICGPATVPWSNPSSAVKGKGGAACNSLAPRDFLPPPRVLRSSALPACSVQLFQLYLEIGSLILYNRSLKIF